MRIRQYIELAVNGCDCQECLDAIIRTAEDENAAEIATLRAEVERLREALREVARDPRKESACIGDGWAFYEDAMNYAKDALK